MFWLLRPRPRAVLTSLAQRPLPELSTAASLFGPRLLPAALTSRALPCSGHGSDASRTFRAASASTLGARSLPPALLSRATLPPGWDRAREDPGTSSPKLPRVPSRQPPGWAPAP